VRAPVEVSIGASAASVCPATEAVKIFSFDIRFSLFPTHPASMAGVIRDIRGDRPRRQTVIADGGRRWRPSDPGDAGGPQAASLPVASAMVSALRPN
jgi:hypothetical protein